MQNVETTELSWKDPEQELPEPFQDVLVLLKGGEITSVFLYRPRNDLPWEWRDFEGEIARKVLKWTPQPYC